MFSGLVQEIATVSLVKGEVLAVKSAGAAPKKGDSIAINGACLTVVRYSVKGKTKEIFFEISEETFAKTTLGRLKNGARVNLERALTMKDALGGHIVQGHVDGVARVTRIVPQGEMKTIWYQAPKDLMRYLVPKGSVTVDGVSLTAAEISGDTFAVALIPYTLEHTTLGAAKVGDAVNLEGDVIGKYVEKYMKDR